MPKLFITENGKYTSLDPLDADATENILVARMLFATPVQPMQGKMIESMVLNSFTFNEDSNSIELKIKEGLEFSNNQKIMIEDIEMSILRMAYKRPHFPVINKIKGINDWIKKEYPLESKLEGITIFGNTLKITFKEKTRHPLLRLSMEVFGIIPRAYVNTKTGGIVGKVPTSGPYIIQSESKNSITFQLNENFNLSDLPKNIIFQYEDIKIAIEKLSATDENAIIYASESTLSKLELENIHSSFSNKKTPTARFASLLINANSKKFESRSARRKLRDQFKSMIEIKYQGVISYAPSIFIDKTFNNPTSQIGKSSKNKNEFINNEEITVGHLGETNSLQIELIDNLASELKSNSIRVIHYQNKDKLIQDFNEGSIDLYFSGSGFSETCPEQDLKMLFTPGLHGLLRHQQEDQVLQLLIDNLENTPSEENHSKVNQYLYDDASFNVYRNVSRFYFGKNQAIVEGIPVGDFNTNPWEIFQSK
jgi:hypothetical protein